MALRRISARIGLIDLLGARHRADDRYARPPSRWSLAAPRVLVAVAGALALVATLAAALGARDLAVTLLFSAVEPLPLAALFWWINKLHWRRYRERQAARRSS